MDSNSRSSEKSNHHHGHTTTHHETHHHSHDVRGYKADHQGIQVYHGHKNEKDHIVETKDEKH
jgi:hypothetical protein